jgi:uncharacterized membrane protein YccC
VISREPRSRWQQSLTGVKLAVAAAGVAVWAIGARSGDRRLSWLGVGLLFVAFLLRFARPRTPRGE